MPKVDYDALVLGGGHNGLVAAAYLARAGLRVGVLERRQIVGGACVTEELFPGFRLSTCSYVCHLLQSRVIDDLRLRDHGFQVYPLDPWRFHPYPDGRRLLLWEEVERTQEEIARFSTRDAQRYPEWVRFWDRAAKIIYPYFLTEPPTLAQLWTKVEGTPDAAILERMLTGSMRDLVEEYFEDEAVRGTFIHAHDVGDPDAPGGVYCYAHIKCGPLGRSEDIGIVRGGMGGITQAMARAAEGFGAEIRTGVEVAKVLTEGEGLSAKAIGARLNDGSEIRARVVLSNADPKRTFLKLTPPAALPEEFRTAIARLRTEAVYLKLHAALDELPDFSRFGPGEYDPRLIADVKICPSIDYFRRAWTDARSGRPSAAPVMEVQLPTVLDDTLAPSGKHVMSIWGLYAPVHPLGGSWDELREPAGEALLETLAGYAPNLRRAIREWSLLTPADMEARVGLTDGNIRHLDIIPNQYLGRRPLPGWASYRTPLTGLYLCGAGAHPGGEVTGAPGHNAAHAVLRDLGVLDQPMSSVSNE